MTNSKPAFSKTETYLFLFFSAAVIGFIWEVLYTFWMYGDFYKRGFFYGPWLPLYGSGAVSIFCFLHKKKKQPIFCFFFSGIISSAIELFTGLLQHKLWGLRYWDYSGRFLNLSGYICLLSFVTFGIAGALYTGIVAPYLLSKWEPISRRMRHIILKVLILLFIFDFCVSIIFPNKGTGITF